MKALSEEARQLISEASASDLPPSAAEQHVWQSLSRQFSLPLPPSAAAAEQALSLSASTTSTALTGAGLGAGLVKGVAAVAVACASALTWYAARPSPAQPTLQPSKAAIVAPARLGAAEAATSQEPQGQAPAAPAPLQGTARSAHATGSSLSHETQLIAAAQRALRSGSPAAALRSLDQHAARHADGALAQEREGVRVLALCALGRNVEARRARQQFLQRWPGSPLSAKVRAACLPPAAAR